MLTELITASRLRLTDFEVFQVNLNTLVVKYKGLIKHLQPHLPYCDVRSLVNSIKSLGIQPKPIQDATSEADSDELASQTSDLLVLHNASQAILRMVVPSTWVSLILKLQQYGKESEDYLC